MCVELRGTACDCVGLRGKYSILPSRRVVPRPGHPPRVAHDVFSFGHNLLYSASFALLQHSMHAVY